MKNSATVIFPVQFIHAYRFTTKKWRQTLNVRSFNSMFLLCPFLNAWVATISHRWSSRLSWNQFEMTVSTSWYQLAYMSSTSKYARWRPNFVIDMARLVSFRMSWITFEAKNFWLISPYTLYSQPSHFSHPMFMKYFYTYSEMPNTCIVSWWRTYTGTISFLFKILYFFRWWGMKTMLDFASVVVNNMGFFFLFFLFYRSSAMPFRMGLVYLLLPLGRWMSLLHFLLPKFGSMRLHSRLQARSFSWRGWLS